MTYSEDTIVAISTPLGVSGIGIVRLSGPDAVKIAEKIFKPKNPSKVVATLRTFTTHLGYVVDNNKVVDEVLMTIMRAPHSYTCEDVVEFSCHGGPLILKEVLELCLRNGARIAEPGEFTKRAFLNGRIDLSQAEAVCELINSKTELQRRLSTNSLLGKTKEKITEIANFVKEAIAEIEVAIDYPDEEDIKTIRLSITKQKIEDVISEIRTAVEYTEKIFPIINGINVAIVGKVNVGKSSLLNLLLNYERAIVSDIPGTTRDTISEIVNIKGIPIRIVDTAGIRQHSQDPIEKTGIERTKNAVKDADVIILMFDGSQEVSDDDYTVIKIILTIANEGYNKTVIPVINKIDMPQKIFATDKIMKMLMELQGKVRLYPEVVFNNFDDFKNTVVKISCVTKEGVEGLLNNIVSSQSIYSDIFSSQDAQETLIITNMRQKELLVKTQQELEKAVSLDFDTSAELVSEHLKEAVRNLQRILGGDLTEDVLDIIFSRFCVGK
ncbi:MAG: tRNA uridine-5-carboxymethylaminomethyl(34) synthesis GTPase MnmE [Endomicrobia bacterium]|nr:tRNA uridine-5-carboxymethylaminomethyl(34) synthesis GTPase MnmE [Endomicrobiia bacterium]